MNQPLTKRWFQLRHHPTIEAAYRCEDRFQFYQCGRRAYKSELMKRKGVMNAPIPGPHGPRVQMFSAPTQKQAKKIFWDDLIALSPREWIKKINRTELIIEYIFGSTIEVAGLDQPQRIEGRGYDNFYVDESADVKPSAIAISILPALADRQGALTRAGVPKRTGRGARDYNRAFAYVQQHGKIDGTNFKASAFKWMSNAVLSEDELSVQRALLDEKDYREQFEATIETAGGGIFHSWGADNIQPCQYDPARQIIVGMDFNVSPMAWVFAHEVDGVLRVFDELWMLDTNTPESLNEMARRYASHRAGFIVYGDASGRQRNTAAVMSNYAHVANDKRFRGLKILVPDSNPAIADRFSSTNAMMRSAAGTIRMAIDPRCSHLIEDVESDSYKDGTMIRDETDKMRGHSCDSLGYICHSRYPYTFKGGGGRQGVTTT